MPHQRLRQLTRQLFSPIVVDRVVEVEATAEATAEAAEPATRAHIKNRRRIAPSPVVQCLYTCAADHSSEIADTGHTASQAPHERQASGSMLYCVSPWLIADTGHPSAQDPQEMHESEIT